MNNATRVFSACSSSTPPRTTLYSPSPPGSESAYLPSAICSTVTISSSIVGVPRFCGWVCLKLGCPVLKVADLCFGGSGLSIALALAISTVFIFSWSGKIVLKYY